MRLPIGKYHIGMRFPFWQKVRFLEGNCSELRRLSQVLFGKQAWVIIGIIWYHNEQNRISFYLVPQKL